MSADYDSPFGAMPVKEVTLKDNVLTATIEVERDGQSIKVEYKGKPRGDGIKGTVDYDFAGQAGTLEFTGKREEEKKDAPAEEKPAEEKP